MGNIAGHRAGLSVLLTMACAASVACTASETKPPQSPSPRPTSSDSSAPATVSPTAPETPEPTGSGSIQVHVRQGGIVWYVAINLAVPPFDSILNVRGGRGGTMYGTCTDPASHVGLCLGRGWSFDYPDAATIAVPLLDAKSIGREGCCNLSSLGAPRSLLRLYRYEVDHVPSVQWWLRKCEGEITDRPGCWADLDRHLMLDVIPVIPISFDNATDAPSGQVSNYTWDVLGQMPALDKLVVHRR